MNNTMKTGISIQEENEQLKDLVQKQEKKLNQYNKLLGLNKDVNTTPAEHKQFVTSNLIRQIIKLNVPSLASLSAFKLARSKEQLLDLLETYRDSQKQLGEQKVVDAVDRMIMLVFK